MTAVIEFSQRERAPVLASPTGILGWESHWTHCRTVNLQQQATSEILESSETVWLITSAINPMAGSQDAFVKLLHLLLEKLR